MLMFSRPGRRAGYRFITDALVPIPDAGKAFPRCEKCGKEWHGLSTEACPGPDFVCGSDG